MRPDTICDAFAESAFCSETLSEELQPATYRETAEAIFMALAESGLEHDPSGEWMCEIELLGDYLDVSARVSKAISRTNH